MSRDNSEDVRETTRRAFLAGTSALVGAGLLGVGAPAGASAEEGVDPAFANVRVREAQHAWDRGYRGRPDRTLALTDSGTDSRHPDLEAPDDVAESDRDTFGPIAVTTDTDDEGTLTDREWITLSGTDSTVTVVAEET